VGLYLSLPKLSHRFRLLSNLSAAEFAEPIRPIALPYIIPEALVINLSTNLVNIKFAIDSVTLDGDTI
jgi:hypothetical protein